MCRWCGCGGARSDPNPEDDYRKEEDHQAGEDLREMEAQAGRDLRETREEVPGDGNNDDGGDEE